MNNTKLKIKYGQVEFEIESDSDTVAKEREQFLKTLPVLFSATNKEFSVIQNNNSEKIYIDCQEKKLISTDEVKYDNINTMIREKGFETEIDLCLAVAFYLQEYEKMESINSNNIKEKMKKSKMSIPKNISISINRLAKRGYLQLIDDLDSSIASYYVTNSGKEYIEQFIKKETHKIVKNNNRVKKIIESKYKDVNKEMLHLEKYPSIIELKSTKDKIMLLFYIFKDNSIGEYFTINDVIFVMSNIFNEKVTRDMVGGQFKNDNTKMFYDKRNIEGNSRIKEFKLLAVGEKYVEDNILLTPESKIN